MIQSGQFIPDIRLLVQRDRTLLVPTVKQKLNDLAQVMSELPVSRKLKTAWPRSPGHLHHQVVSSTVLLPQENGKIEKQKKNFDHRHFVKDRVAAPRGSYRRNSLFLTRAHHDDVLENAVQFKREEAKPEIPVPDPPLQKNPPRQLVHSLQG